MAPDADISLVVPADQPPDASIEGVEVHTHLQPRRLRKKMSAHEVQETEVASLSRYIKTLPPELHHVIFIPTTITFDIELLLMLARCDFGDNAPRLAGRVLRLEVIASRTPEEITELANYCRNRRLLIYTETQEMADKIESRFGVPVAGTMLFPCMIEPHSAHYNDVSAQTHADTWSVMFFGNPREEKGVELQPRILSSLRQALKRQPLSKPVHVFTQTYWLSKLKGPKRKHNYRMMREAAINRINPAGLSIQLAFNPIPDAQFLANLNSADLLVLPYLTPPYDTAGSGLVIDGALAGKAFVHTNGMAMNEFLNCGNAESADTAEDFGPMIVTMLTQLNCYAEGKVEARQRVLKAMKATGEELRRLLTF
ncbi:MAG: hypothetical protein ACK5KM_16075 [Hyphomicrobiaceae bacterium]